MPSRDIAKRLRALEAEMTEEYGIGHPWAHELAAIRVKVEAVAKEMYDWDCGTNRNDFDCLHGTFPIPKWADRLAKGKP